MTGGRSSGARVACRTAAETGAAGVLCLAFPVHPPGRPEKSRLDELDAVPVPVLVVQGERDPFGMPPPAKGRTVVEVAGDHGLKADTAALEAAVTAWLESGWLFSARVAIADERALREVIGQPTELVAAKVADRLNHLTRQFVERSPFVCVATSRPDGGLDVSPRGDPAGFVRILDERTLLLPDRPGNRLADTLTNLLADPRIALLFLIPGVGDSFRVNGRARIVDDPELLAASAVEGKAPKLGILVEIEEAFTQCSKALVRSDLWNPEQARRPLGAAELRRDPRRDRGPGARRRASTSARAPSATHGAKASTKNARPDEFRGEERSRDRQDELHGLRAVQLRLAARARLHRDRHFLEASVPPSRSGRGASTSGARLVYGLREERQCLRIDGVEAARRVPERAGRARTPPPAAATAVPKRRAGLGEVAIRGDTRRSTTNLRADGDVARAASHERQQARELSWRVLAIRIDASAERVAVRSSA